MRYTELPIKLRLLILAQGGAAFLAAVMSWRSPSATEWGALFFLALCGAIGGACKVDVNVRLGRLSLGFTVTYFTLLILGTSAAMFVALCCTMGGLLFNLKEEKRRFDIRKAWSCQTLYNCCNGLLSTACMGWTFAALGGHPGQVDVQSMALPILASAFAYYLINTGGVTLAIGWSQGVHPAEVFLKHFAWAWSGFLAGACISAGLVWTYQAAGAGTAGLLLLPPSYLVYYFYRLQTEKVRADVAHMREVNRLNDAVIGSLAMAIEAKDRHTGGHVDRVREYAVHLGQKLGVTPDELQALRIAARLHDIGKIGISESILCKPGKLTPEEFEIIKTHVDIGAAILEEVQFPWPVVPIVRSHHERWDGLGYPMKLKGEEIPIGGRIISLVDVYDALTSNRPYRRPMTREQAIQILRSGSGTQFDPLIVETFIELLPQMDAILEELELAAHEEPAAAAAILAPAASREPDVNEEEVLARMAGHVSSGRTIAAFAPGVAEELQQLVPYSTFALFLTNPSHRTLIPLHVSGMWPEMLEGMEIRVGEGATGHTAATGEALVNVSASLDLARRVRPNQNLELNSTLCVPVTVNGRTVGTLTAYHSGYNFYQPYHRARLERVARLVAGAVEPEALVGRGGTVSRLTETSALLQFLHGELIVAQTREEQFAVALIRADRPAPRYGRMDRTLDAVSRILGETVREGDYTARSAGSGFVMVLPRCGEHQAAGLVHRLVERIRATDESLLGVLSFGLSLYPGDGSTPGALLAAAEGRLGDCARPLEDAAGLVAAAAVPVRA